MLSAVFPATFDTATTAAAVYVAAAVAAVFADVRGEPEHVVAPGQRNYGRRGPEPTNPRPSAEELVYLKKKHKSFKQKWCGRGGGKVLIELAIAANRIWWCTLMG